MLKILRAKLCGDVFTSVYGGTGAMLKIVRAGLYGGISRIISAFVQALSS